MRQLNLNFAIGIIFAAYLILFSGSVASHGQTIKSVSIGAIEDPVKVTLSDGVVIDQGTTHLGDAPEYNFGDAPPYSYGEESAEALSQPIVVDQNPVDDHFSNQPHYTEHELIVDAQSHEMQETNFQMENHEYYPPENYLHLLYPPTESDAEPNIALPQSTAERQLSHCRAGNPRSFSKYASLTYDSRYKGYFVGGGVPTGRRYHRGEPRALDEGTWGVDYAPRYSRVASNWSHGKLYQGGVGQYEPDHKNRPLSGQTFGRYFSKRERHSEDEAHEMHHHSGEESEPLFETEVTDADSPNH